MSDKKSAPELLKKVHENSLIPSWITVATDRKWIDRHGEVVFEVHYDHNMPFLNIREQTNMVSCDAEFLKSILDFFIKNQRLPRWK